MRLISVIFGIDRRGHEMVKKHPGGRPHLKPDEAIVVGSRSERKHGATTGYEPGHQLRLSRADPSTRGAQGAIRRAGPDRDPLISGFPRYGEWAPIGRPGRERDDIA